MLHLLRCSALTMILLVFACSEADAAMLTRTFVIDPNLSGYSVSGTWTDTLGNSVPLLEQAPESMTAHMAGELTVQYELGGTITFLGGQIRTLDQPGPFIPFGTPANVAYQATRNAGTTFVAQREFNTRIVGSTSLGPAGSFITAGLTTDFNSGRIEYTVPGQTGASQLQLAGVSIPFDSDLSGFLDSDASGGPQITIPFSAGTMFSLDGNVEGRFEGTIVAQAVPEPSSLALIVMGTVCFSGCVLRKRWLTAQS